MVHFNVSFQSFNSFADITLSLATALSQLQVPVSLEPSPLSPDILKILDPQTVKQLQQWMRQPASELFQLKWSHYWPDFQAIQLEGHVNCELFAINYEFKQPPFDDWVEKTAQNRNHKLAISQYCQQVLRQAGCPENQVSVLPLACNPFLYNYSNPQNFLLREKRTKIRILHLTNSWDLYRFGTDLLIPIFCQMFKNHPQIELLIKDGGSHQNAVQNLINTTQAQLGETVENIHVVRRLLNKEDLGKLYLLADGLIAPFRGEGFAIKLLDGFAAGLPVAMPLYGGVTEYGNHNNCYPIDYDLLPVQTGYDTQAIQVQNRPYWAEPKVDSIREQLDNIITDKNRFLIGLEARKTAEQFSWQTIATKLLSILRQLGTSL